MAALGKHLTLPPEKTSFDLIGRTKDLLDVFAEPLSRSWLRGVQFELQKVTPEFSAELLIVNTQVSHNALL